MLKKNIDNDSNTNNISMQRIDLSDEFDFDILSIKSVSSEVSNNIEKDICSLQKNAKKINNSRPTLDLSPCCNWIVDMCPIFFIIFVLLSIVSIFIMSQVKIKYTNETNWALKSKNYFFIQ